MRLKFKKGITPEVIADKFLEYIYENNLVIGAVNIYIQTYNDQMETVKFDDDYLVYSPSEKAKKAYDERVAQIRRSKIKAIQ